MADISTVKGEPENPTAELYRRIIQTSHCRFIGARRLALRDTIAQWTLSLVSVALIAIPLLQAMNLTRAVEAQALNVLEVILAVVVLVCSLLINKENNALRADRMHSCALELRNLAWELLPHKDAELHEHTFKEFVAKYASIMKAFENHASLDYDCLRLQQRAWYYPTKRKYAWAVCRFAFGYIVSLAPYVGLALAIVVSLTFILY
jgi:hypothetical protein